jgi:DNA-binding CsgD family transcriptional regulator
MNAFSKMLQKITSSPHHNRMKRFVEPLEYHFGINHFWYYKITNSGNYSYVGTHSAWNEFCFDNSMLSHFSCLRHPDNLQKGINLMKADAGDDYKSVLDHAWNKYRINFNINVVNSISEGIEAFGFASCYNDTFVEQRMLNALPLLKQFSRAFQNENREILALLEDNQVSLPAYFGPLFYERPKSLMIPIERDEFIKKMGFGSILSLTPRELDVIKLLSSGYPANYIAKQLQLQKRTIENYIATIKFKLSCRTKVELIQKSQEIGFLGYFD